MRSAVIGILLVVTLAGLVSWFIAGGDDGSTNIVTRPLPLKVGIGDAHIFLKSPFALTYREWPAGQPLSSLLGRSSGEELSALESFLRALNDGTLDKFHVDGNNLPDDPFIVHHLSTGSVHVFACGKGEAGNDDEDASSLTYVGFAGTGYEAFNPPSAYPESLLLRELSAAILESPGNHQILEGDTFDGKYKLREDQTDDTAEPWLRSEPLYEAGLVITPEARGQVGIDPTFSKPFREPLRALWTTLNAAKLGEDETFLANIDPEFAPQWKQQFDEDNEYRQLTLEALSVRREILWMCRNDKLCLIATRDATRPNKEQLATEWMTIRYTADGAWKFLSRGNHDPERQISQNSGLQLLLNKLSLEKQFGY